MANICTIKSSPGKGIGVFSTKPITPGTVIMRDRTIMKLRRPAQDVTEAQVNSAFALLPPKDQESFLRLHENNLPYTTQAMRIYKSNCFGDEQYSWLFLHLSRLNHSCHPNAELTKIDPSDDHVELVALKPIASGQELSISYLGPFEDGPRRSRRELLRVTYGFACQCATCSLTGLEAARSDLRRQLINVLSHRQQGLEPEALRYLDDVNGLDSGGGGGGGVAATLGRSKCPLRTPLTPAEKVAGNFLLAKLLEAEGLVNYRLAQAYAIAGVSLMGQMQDLKPFVILPSAGYLLEWLNAAMMTMRKVRGAESVDVVELEQACHVLQSNSYMVLAKSAMGKKAKGTEPPFATVFGQPGRYLTQQECILEVRKMQSRSNRRVD